MGKRKTFILGIFALCFFCFAGKPAFAEGETAFPLETEESSAEGTVTGQEVAEDNGADSGTGESGMEVTASLYQAGALETEASQIAVYSLDAEERERQIYQSLSTVSAQLDLSGWGITADEFGAAFEQVVNGHPELFYVSNEYTLYSEKNTGRLVRAVWNYWEKDQSRIASMKSEMEAKISGILAKTDASMTAVEKLMVVHEALVVNTSYGRTTSWNNGKGCYTAYCALVEGKAVCQGYALAFDLLAERLGISTEFVGSTDLDHAWNLVLLDGETYHVDCTWDDQDRAGEVLHRNFLLSDAAVKATGHSSWNNMGLSGTRSTYDDYYWRERAYDYEFVKKDSLWYQIDRKEAPEQEWKRVGPSLLNPEIITSLYGAKLSETECSLEKGKTKKLSFTALPGLSGKSVQWRSTDGSVASVDAWGMVTGIRTGTARIYASVDGITRSCIVRVKAAPVSVRYRAHVQSQGWQGWALDGTLSGTTDLAKRLEAVRIEVTGNPNVGVSYQAHVQSQGWQGWVSDGAMAGTENRAKRMEAVRIRLTGAEAEAYDIYYRVHVQSYGWLGWAKNGESAGTQGLAKRLEAIEIQIVEKGSKAPGSVKNTFIQAPPTVTYETHVQTYGWQNGVSNGAMAGTVGQAKRMEAVRISLSNLPVSGSIRYQGHVQTYGWQNWASDGAKAGTENQAKRLEAIRIELTGALAAQYDVYYRVHVQTYGWQDWVKNGEVAGTVGEAKRLEAIEIRLEKKN